MKAYTDLEQSKKLATILPLESADMYYALSEDESTNMVNFGKPQGFFDKTQVAWSLTALLNVLPPTIISDGIESCNIEMFKSLDGNTWYFQYFGEFDIILETKGAPIDACVEMIVKLNEVKML